MSACYRPFNVHEIPQGCDAALWGVLNDFEET